MPRSLPRWMPPLVVPASCASDCGYGLEVVTPEVSTGTEAGWVDDAGTFPIGVPSVLYVTLTVDVADVVVERADVLDVDSAKAFYTLQEWADLTGAVPEGVDNADAVLGGRPAIVYAQTTGFAYPFVYFSPDEAWSQAEISFELAGRYGATTQDIRAHAAAASDTGDDLEDRDHDGFTVAEGDCDDDDGWAHPGAEEVLDGVDNDCEGHVDDVPVTEEPDATDGRPTGCATGAVPSPTAAVLLGLVAVRRRGRRVSAATHEPRRPEVERPRR